MHKKTIFMLFTILIFYVYYHGHTTSRTTMNVLNSDFPFTMELIITIDDVKTSDMICKGDIFFWITFNESVNLSQLPDEIYIDIFTDVDRKTLIAYRSRYSYGGAMDDLLYRIYGKPEFYPFDCYYFCLDMIFSDILLNFSSNIYELNIEIRQGYWPCKLSRIFGDINRITFEFLLQRPMWQSVPFLIFFILFFSGLSSIIFLNKRARETLYKRLVYLSGFALLLLAFSLNFQAEVPKHITFLPLPSIMLISALTSIIILFIVSIISSTKNYSYFVTDLIGLLYSIFLTSLLIQILIYNCKAWKWGDSMEYLLLAIRLVALSYIAGVILYCMVSIYARRTDQARILPFLRYKIWSNYLKHMLYLSMIIDCFSALLTLYWISVIGPSIELNPLWQYIFTKLYGTPWIYILPFCALILIFITLRILENKLKEHIFLKDFLILSIFYSVTLDFINNTVFIDPCCILYGFFPLKPTAIVCAMIFSALLGFITTYVMHKYVLIFF